VTSVRDDERDKQNRLVSLHEEFRQLLDVGASDEDEEGDVDEDGDGDDNMAKHLFAVGSTAMN